MIHDAHARLCLGCGFFCKAVLPSRRALSTSRVSIYRQVRDRMLDGAEPASTLLVVSGLADPNWHVEIQVVAAAG
jgi:enamine deaminase RidA (YjgF/YER057c/UK114 family)